MALTYDPRKPGAHLAEFMSALVGPDLCVPVRDRVACAHCEQQVVQKGDKLKKCERCLAASYCGAECQRQHWRVHKRSCSTKEQRIDKVLKGINGHSSSSDDDEPSRRCSRALAGAALDATGQHVEASRVLCAGLTTGGLTSVGDEEEIFATWKLMFSVKLSPSDFTNVLNADPAIAAFYAERRASKDAEEAARAASMEQVIRLCAGIHESLVTILPVVMLQRYTGPGSPHSSNQDLVDYVHAKIAASYINIPAFLRLADECLAFTDSNKSRFKMPGCPFSPQQIRRKIAVLKKLVFSTWVQFSRNFEHDHDSADDKIVEVSRTRWYIHSLREVGLGGGGPGMPLEEWMKQPGNWLPLST